MENDLAGGRQEAGAGNVANLWAGVANDTPPTIVDSSRESEWSSFFNVYSKAIQLYPDETFKLLKCCLRSDKEIKK